MNIDELVKVIDSVLVKRIKHIHEDSEQTYTGMPGDLISELAEAINREFPCMRKWHTYDRGSGPCVDCGQTKQEVGE